MINSREYWENRYKSGGNSGAGSYGKLAKYKAHFINLFIKERNFSVVEFGCGDGNQLSLFECDNYVGYDISPTVIKNCKEKFSEDSTKHFYEFDEYNNEKFDLSLSLDVIFHLVEDTVFEEYMRKLFESSNNYVIIYSSNGDTNIKFAPHLKDRKFTSWVTNNIPDFNLYLKLDNPYKYHDNLDNAKETSISDFYIYKKI